MAHKLVRIAAASVSTVGLLAGLSSGIVGASAGNNNGTGPDSTNHVSSITRTNTTVNNNASLGVTNNNPQFAFSGSAHSSDNTTGGKATSGAAGNNSHMAVSATVTGTSMGSGSGSSSNNTGTNSNTGPNSDNTVRAKTVTNTTINNNTSARVTNNNTQVAVSGDARDSHNTTGGGAQTGDATNTSSDTYTFNFSY